MSEIVFSEKLNIAKVTSTFKSGEKLNYRPISVLPSFAKIPENVSNRPFWMCDSKLLAAKLMQVKFGTIGCSLCRL